MGDDPPYLTVGTEVSAKYKGAFCEAKIKKVVRIVKCKVTFKSGLGSVQLSDDLIKGSLRVGATVEAKHPDKNLFIEAIVNKIQDCSQYTVVFDDGDITTLRRSALCLKSGRHFNESETLDQLPLTHPEHFSNPVVGGRRNVRRRGRDPQSNDNLDESSDDDSSVTTSPSKKSRRKNGKHESIGKVVCVEITDKKKGKDTWFPALIVSPSAQETVKIRIKDEYLVRSFRDGRYYTVPKKEITEFTKDGTRPEPSSNILKSAVDKALQFLEKNELPPHWDREALFADIEEPPEEVDHSDSDESEDNQTEERDRFVAQLYKFMDERGTPINKVPLVCNKDLDLYKLYKTVSGKGGYNKVTNSSQWKPVTIKMGFGPMPSTSTINLVKQGYKKYIHNFDELNRKLGFNSLNQITSASNAASRSNRSLFRDRHASSSSSTKEIIKKEEPPKEEEPPKKVEEEPPKPVTPEKKEEPPQPEETPRRSRSRQETRLKRDTTDDSSQVSSSPEKEPSKPPAKKRKTMKIKEEIKKEPVEIETPSEVSEVTQVIPSPTPTRKVGIRGKYKKRLKPEKEVVAEVVVKEEIDHSPPRQHINSDVRIQVGDKLKVYYGPEGKSYGAKVVEANEIKQQYLVHYHGWNNRYDEWVPRERILENISLRSDQQSSREKNSNQIESATSGSETGGSTKGPHNPKGVRKKKTSNASSLNSDSSSRGVRTPVGATTRKRLSSEGDVPFSKRKPRRRASLSGPESVEDSSDSEGKAVPETEVKTHESESKKQNESGTAPAGNNAIDVNQVQPDVKGLDKIVRPATPETQPTADATTSIPQPNSNSDVYEFSDEAPPTAPALKMYSPRSPEKKEEQHLTSAETSSPVIQTPLPVAATKPKVEPTPRRKKSEKLPSPRKKVATPKTNSTSTKQKEKAAAKANMIPFPPVQTVPPMEVRKVTVKNTEKTNVISMVEVKPPQGIGLDSIPVKTIPMATITPKPVVPAPIPRLLTPTVIESSPISPVVSKPMTITPSPVLIQPQPPRLQLQGPAIIPGVLKTPIIRTPHQPICIRPTMATISPVVNNNTVKKQEVRTQLLPHQTPHPFSKKEIPVSEPLVVPFTTVSNAPKITIVSHTAMHTKPANATPVVPEKHFKDVSLPSVPTVKSFSVPPSPAIPNSLIQPVKPNSIPNTLLTPVSLPVKKKRKAKSHPVVDSSSDSAEEVAKVKPIRKKPKVDAHSKPKKKNLQPQISPPINTLDIKSTAPKYDDTPVIGVSVVYNKPKPIEVLTTESKTVNNKLDTIPSTTAKPALTNSKAIQIQPSTVPQLPPREILTTTKSAIVEPIKLISSPAPVLPPVQFPVNKIKETQANESKPLAVYPPQSVLRTEIPVLQKAPEVKQTEARIPLENKQIIKEGSIELKDDKPPSISSISLPIHEDESRNSLLCEEEIPGSPQPEIETEKRLTESNESLGLNTEIKIEPIEPPEQDRPEETLLHLNRHRSLPSPVFGSTGISNALPNYKSNNIHSTPPSTPDSSSLSSRSPRDHDHIDQHDGDISNFENGLSKSPKMLDRSDTDSLDLDGLPQSNEHDMDDNSNSSESGAKYYGKSPTKRINTYDKNDGNYSPPGQRRRIPRKKSPDDYSRPYRGRPSGGRRMGSYGHLNDSGRIIPPVPPANLGDPPTSEKFKFIPTLDDTWDSETKINAILTGMQDAREKYNEIKSQLASYEKKKRKQKKREREKQKEIERALKKEANHTGNSDDDDSTEKLNDIQTSSSPIPNSR